MRIAILSRNFPPEHEWGGDGVLYARQATALARAGADVTVICQGAPGHVSGTYDGVRVVRVLSDPSRHGAWSRINYNLQAWQRLSQVNRHSRYDVLEAPYWSGEGLWPALRHGAPVVIADHGYGDSPPTDAGRVMLYGSRLMAAAGIQSMRLADVITCGTESAKVHLTVNHPSIADRARVVHLGIDTDRYRPHRVDRGSIGLREDRPYGLYVGSLSARRGIDIALETTVRIRQVEPRFTLIVAGQDTPTAPGGGLWLEWASNRFRDRLGTDALLYLGVIPETQLVDLYATADLAIIPIRNSSFSLTVIEALASGTPTVTSNAGVVPELNLPGRAVKVVLGSSSQEYAAAGIELLRSRGNHHVDRLDTFRSHFSIEGWLGRLTSAYEQARSKWLLRRTSGI